MYKDRQTSNSLYIYHERCYTSPKEWILAVDLNLGSDIHGQIDQIHYLWTLMLFIIFTIPNGILTKTPSYPWHTF